jgi:uncharacterized BrkB/YihY/UPF0761 family membrane protein
MPAHHRLSHHSLLRVRAPGSARHLVRTTEPATRFVEVWAAALCATVFLRGGENVVVCYLKNFATLNAVCGRSGGIMALLLWIYLCGAVFIFGACLCAGQAEIHALSSKTTKEQAE